MAFCISCKNFVFCVSEILTNFSTQKVGIVHIPWGLYIFQNGFHIDKSYRACRCVCTFALKPHYLKFIFILFFLRKTIDQVCAASHNSLTRGLCDILWWKYQENCQDVDVQIQDSSKVFNVSEVKIEEKKLSPGWRIGNFKDVTPTLQRPLQKLVFRASTF